MSLFRDIQVELQLHDQMTKRRRQITDVAIHQEAFLAAYGQALLGEHHTLATSSTHTPKPSPARDLSFRFTDAFDEPPWAIMRRASRWRAKSAAAEC